MKKNVASILGLVLFFLTGQAGKCALIADWNFSSQTTGTAPASMSADHGSGSMDLSQLASDGDANITISGGTMKNAVAVDGDLSALIISAGIGEDENGKSIIISLNTSGYQNIILSYATERSTTGFTSQQWSYSTDGIHYTSFGSAITPTTSYAVETVDFTGASAVNNKTTIYFETTLTGASGSSAGSDHFDNLQFNATIIPVPEPAWGTFSAIGLLAVCGLREWRRHNSSPG